MTRLHITAHFTQFFWFLNKEKSCASEPAERDRHKLAAVPRPGLFVVPEVSNFVRDALSGIFQAVQKRQDNRQHNN